MEITIREKRFGAAAGILTLAALVFLAAPASIAAPAPTAASENSYALLVSPKYPGPGDTLHVLAAGARDLKDAEIIVQGPSGRISGQKSRLGGGPPFWKCTEFKADDEGAYTISLIEKRKTLASRQITATPTRPRRSSIALVWPNESVWDRQTEALYSAWIDSLFHDSDEGASWSALHEVTRDARRNILWNHLGLGEDDPGRKDSVIMEPDCADNPFYLRAYFAWKMGLPFGFHECDRGWVGRAPRTGRWTTNSSWPGRANQTRAFNEFLRAIMNAVHSGTARTKLEDDSSDYYPLPLTRDGLRPGTVFADPYGHTLVIVRWLPQADDHPGRLLAVDAQPDGTVAVKRFWNGNFLFTTSDVIGDPGFKAFRPIVLDNGHTRLLRNVEIAASPEYGNFSLQQKNITSRAFYAAMERLINPDPLDPETALRDQCQALHEQLLARVKSVATGEAYLKAHSGVVIPMPSSATGLFQTGGLWEDYSTPNRDLRLLIALDTLLEFPEQVVSSPGFYKLPKRKTPEEIKTKMEELRAQWLREKSITYIRSDGREQILTLEEIFKRTEAFEMGYNPNDGVEIRWGAPEGSAELSSCRRRAPASQRQKMASLRSWFAKRLHPPT